MITPYTLDVLMSWCRREIAEAEQNANIRRGQGSSRGYNYWKGRKEAFEAVLGVLPEHAEGMRDE